MSDLQNALNEIAWPVTEPPYKKLPPESPAQAIPSKVGVGQRAGATFGSGAGDLTLGGAVMITSTDGIFTLTFPYSAVATLGGSPHVIPIVS